MMFSENRFTLFGIMLQATVSGRNVTKLGVPRNHSRENDGPVTAVANRSYHSSRSFFRIAPMTLE